MILLPAIDLYEQKAVRLLKGDYQQMTVYSEHPLEVAQAMENAGAAYLHMVDLEGAKLGTTPNLAVVQEIAQKTKLKIEIGGGVRSVDVIERYLACGVERVILGTAAVTDRAFLESAAARFGEKIAVGADVKDGKIAIKGWLEDSGETMEDFLSRIQALGIRTVICTDISKDGAMQGTNLALYQRLSRDYDLNLIASGGVSDLADIRALKAMGMYGAIIGKAYYTGAIDLKKALEVAK